MRTTTPQIPSPFANGAARRSYRIALAALAGAATVGLGGLAHLSPAQAADAGRVVSVSSVSALRTAVSKAQPGDQIRLADGRYSVSSAIELKRPGTAAAPITIAAEHVGKAELTGSVGFKVNASDVVIEGFRFTHGTGVSVPATAQRVRITRNVFQLTSAVKNWLTVAGDNAQVDYNTFQNKSTEGVFLQILGPGEKDMAKRVWVHHNRFANHSFAGANSGESIRLGVSARQQASAHALIEHNLLTAANGDVEAISVKSSDNVIRYNRIEKSKGTITLRHGNRNRADGNVLIGGATGIRVFGNDHVVVNNVVQESKGTALEIAGGDVRDDTSSSNKHDAADRVLVAFNTFTANAAKPIRLGASGQSLAPRAITVANNLVSAAGTGGSSPVAQLGGSVGASWAGNMLHNVTGAGLPKGGYRVTNPKLTKDSTGIYRPAADSPVVGSAVGSYPTVTLDMDAQRRPAPASVGADEVSAGSAGQKSLTRAMVGAFAS